MRIPENIDMTGKAALVTGGSNGIGLGCARALLGAGAHVVICARNAENGKAAADQLNAEYGNGSCIFIQCDVSSEEQISITVDAAAAAFGRLDCLVNNAGYHPPYESIDSITGAMFEELLRTNLVSMFNASRCALPYIRKTRGTIINTSSLVGEMGQKRSCRYVSTKGGIIALTKAMAVDEAEHGVRVNCIMPGCISTPLGDEFAKASGNIKEFTDAMSWCHFNRTGTIDECGAVCLFLASEMSSFITGAAIPISGGAELAYGSKFY